MKKILIFLFIAMAAMRVSAQIKTPVKWAYTAKKIADKTYEVHLTAVIDAGWHMYSVDHNADVGIATKVTFKTNPLASAVGKLVVKGKASKLKDPSTGEMVTFYEKTVDLVQVFKLKTNVKTNIIGDVVFMSCDDKQCTPPNSKSFSVSLK